LGSRFAVAFQFLTVLPLFRARVFDPRELARSMGAFPLVGLVLGAGLLLVHGILGGRFPPLVEGAVLTALLAAATGGLHLDGFADTVDGLAGGWTRERALEIMKDSRTGALGAAGLSLLLLLKATSLGLLPAGAKPWGILLMPAVARGGVVLLAYRSTYARAVPGLGTAYTDHLDGLTVRLALLGSGLPCLLLGWRGLVVWGVVLLAILGLRGCFHRRLGGITGDVLGFSEETGEVLFLLLLHLLWGP